MISIDEAKAYLRVDGHDDDVLIVSLVSAAEMYLRNATGRTFAPGHSIARLFCMVLVADWYENREHGGRASDAVRPIVNSMIAQLKYCDDDGGGDGG